MPPSPRSSQSADTPVSAQIWRRFAKLGSWSPPTHSLTRGGSTPQRCANAALLGPFSRITARRRSRTSSPHFPPERLPTGFVRRAFLLRAIRFSEEMDSENNGFRRRGRPPVAALWTHGKEQEEDGGSGPVSGSVRDPCTSARDHRTDVVARGAHHLHASDSPRARDADRGCTVSIEGDHLRDQIRPAEPGGETGGVVPANEKASQPNRLTRLELPLLGSNQDSPDPESGEPLDHPHSLNPHT